MWAALLVVALATARGTPWVAWQNESQVPIPSGARAMLTASTDVAPPLACQRVGTRIRTACRSQARTVCAPSSQALL